MRARGERIKEERKKRGSEEGRKERREGRRKGVSSFSGLWTILIINVFSQILSPRNIQQNQSTFSEFPAIEEDKKLKMMLPS